MPPEFPLRPHKEFSKDLFPDTHVNPPAPMSVDRLPMAKDGQRSPATALPESVENRSQTTKISIGVYRPPYLALVFLLRHQINFLRPWLEDSPLRVR